MQITSDWHIHTTHSCDCAAQGYGIRMATLVEEAARRGIRDLGVTDHLYTPYNLDDIFRSRREFDSLPFEARLHFGIEASCISAWELAEIESGRQPAKTYGLREGGPPFGPLALGLAAEDVAAYGIEYVVAGAHFPLYCELKPDVVIADYHRQNLFLARHELVDVVAHPWWWGGPEWVNELGRALSDPWLDDFGKIPLSMHDEFAAALVEHGTACEINIHACLANPAYPESFGRQYLDYLAYLHERGVVFAIGSDTHGPAYDTDFETIAPWLDEIGLQEEKLWRLPPRKDENT